MQKLINFALCGSYSRDYNPYTVTADEVAQRILLAINTKRLSLQEISSETKIREQEVSQHLEALRRCQLIRETKRDGVIYYHPSFAIFSLTDQRKLKPLIENLSSSLAVVVKDLYPEIREELAKIKCVELGYNFGDLEYIVIGACTFDYAGLEVLREQGLIIVSKKMPGGNYVFTGVEAGIVDLRKSWMWGHNNTYGKYVFSTHGRLPPKNNRRAFPDLGFLWENYAENAEEKRTIEQKIAHYGDLLFQLLQGDLTVEDLSKKLKGRKFELILDLTFLEELRYVVSAVEQRKRKYKLKRPAFVLEDYWRIHRLSRRILMQFVNRSLKASFGEFESLYKETSPAINGVDMREAFNMVYHSIFEKALDKLMASGVIAKPPLRNDGGRYSAWVSMEPAGANRTF